MSNYIAPAENLSEAWFQTLAHVVAGGGYGVNVITTVTNPLAPQDPVIRSALDAVLAEGDRQKVRIQSVDTVAGTIFPMALYADTGLRYSPGMDPEVLAKLDASAEDLYAVYGEMLPVLRTDGANKRGTYFGRMVSWPGEADGGINQVADRIVRLRRSMNAGVGQRNVEDIAIAGEAELLDGAAGVQIYAPSDRRERGFPCLVHIDLTLFEGRLSMAASYRHQILVTKAYGNLVGLCALLAFFAQHTGFGVGELVVNATFADAELRTYTKGVVADLLDAAGGS